MAHRKGSGFTWALDPGREALQKAGTLDFKKAAEFLEDRPESEAQNVMGQANYSEFTMYKNDMRTHSRTLHGPADIHPLPRTQAQEIGFFTQRRKAFVPANGGPYYPRNASSETKIADALARDFAKG